MSELSILHTTDLHGRLSADEAARLRRLKDSLGAILLDSGDCTALPNICAVPWRLPVARRMAEAGYNAVGVGNREWFFRRFGMRWVARSLPCPLVATNIVPADGAGIVPVAVVESGRSGVRVAVLAVARKMVEPDSLLQRLCDHRWVEPAAALAEHVPRAREEAEWVVVLSHLGIADDLRLAETLRPKVDLILGGHDHILTPRGLLSVPTPVVHSGYHGRWVNIVRLRRGEAGVEADVRAERLDALVPQSGPGSGLI